MRKRMILKYLIAALVVSSCTAVASYSLQEEANKASAPVVAEVSAQKAVQDSQKVDVSKYTALPTVTPQPTVEPTVAPSAEPTATPEPTSTPQPTQEPEDSSTMESAIADNSAECEVKHPICTYTDSDRDILALIIYQEAGSDYMSDDTRRYVGSVFLNRVNSSAFPNTFYEVATQSGQYGTLSWTGIQWPSSAQYEQEAVARAYTISDELLTTGSVLPAEVVWQAEFSQGTGTYCVQDNIYFCY